MIKSVYKLDKRIKDVLDIQSSARYDDSFIGEVCYFANSIWEFEDLESCTKGTLSEHIRDCYSSLGNYFTANEFKEDNFYKYFIPENLLKPIEKKYRPFSIREFEDMLASKKDDFVCFRYKFTMDNVSNLFHKLRYLGYVLTEDENYEEPGEGCLHFGNNISGSPKYLFEHLELLSDDGKWVPFGIEE